MATPPQPRGNGNGLPHRLIPLTLAATLVRNRVYGDRQVTDQGPVGDFNMLANFMACSVPLYEYFADGSAPPRALDRASLEGGIFREGGKELHFLDGRAPKRFLAVNELDLECVTAVLRDPEHAVQIYSRFVRLQAQKLKARARALQAEAAQFRAEAKYARGS